VSVPGRRRLVAEIKEKGKMKNAETRFSLNREIHEIREKANPETLTLEP